jgi:hypothetical protein
MNNCKEELVNVILCSMVDKINTEQFEKLKDCLQLSFYNYTIEKIEETELSCGCSNITED